MVGKDFIEYWVFLDLLNRWRQNVHFSRHDIIRGIYYLMRFHIIQYIVVMILKDCVIFVLIK